MSDLPSHWIPHRREDGEVIGWIDMESQEPNLIPIDRLGRPSQRSPTGMQPRKSSRTWACAS